MPYNAISDSSGNISQFTDYIHIVLNHAGALSAYQKKLTINYDSAMQTNFNDIRFNIWNGTAWEYVPYWLESKTDSTTADVWIKNDYNSGNTVVRMYYGNDELSSESSGDNTFIQWHGSTSTSFLDSLIVPYENIVFEGKVKATNASHSVRVGLKTVLDGPSGDELAIDFYSVTNLKYGYARNDGTKSTISESPSLTSGVYVKTKISSDGTTAHYYVDGNEIGTGLTTNLPNQNMGLQLQASNGEQEWSFARKYTSVEPTYTIGTPQHQRRHPQFI